MRIERAMQGFHECGSVFKGDKDSWGESSVRESNLIEMRCSAL